MVVVSPLFLVIAQDSGQDDCERAIDQGAIAAVSANDIWAIGQYLNNGPDEGLVEHWDGKQWTVVNTPNTGSASNALFAVSASSQGVWNVGRIESDITPSTTLTEQWNGSKWNLVSSPSAGPSDNNLYGAILIEPLEGF